MKLLRSTAILLAAVLLLSVVCFAAEITVANETIGGASAKVVYVSLDEDTVVAPVVANNSVSTDAKASDIIAGAGSSLAAAINGNFFMSYYNASQPIDVNTKNYPQIFGALVVEGKMICSGGSAALGFGYDGSIQIGRVTLKAKVHMGTFTFVCWGVNTVYDQPSAVYVLTEEFDYGVNVPSSSTIVEVQNEKVTAMFSGYDGYQVPDDTLAVIIGSSFGTRGVKVGDSASYYFADDNGDKSWGEMRNIIGGSGLIVENGVSAVDNNPGVTASDQNPDLVGQRSFAALLSDGRLMLGTVSSSYRAIAETLISMGVTDAMFLDGGGSSMLYANGRQLTSPGRELASLLGVYDPDVTVSAPSTLPAAQDVPSSWAKSDVDEADALGILPQNLAGKYQQSITRGEFCQLIAGYIYAETGKNIEDFCKAGGLTVDAGRFTDTGSKDVACVAALGIVDGYPDGTFRSNADIKRQDAAIMLRRLAQTMGAEASGQAKSFTDGVQISDYAKPGVDFVTGLGIMNGHTGGKFAPKNPITREQAVITIMNTRRVL